MLQGLKLEFERWPERHPGSQIEVQYPVLLDSTQTEDSLLEGNTYRFEAQRYQFSVSCSRGTSKTSSPACEGLTTSHLFGDSDGIALVAPGASNSVVEKCSISTEHLFEMLFQL